MSAQFAKCCFSQRFSQDGSVRVTALRQGTGVVGGLNPGGCAGLDVFCGLDGQSLPTFFIGAEPVVHLPTYPAL